MGETINIAEMAEKVSDEIFSVFGRTKIGPTNEDWTCKQPDAHGRHSHPTDVVFYYDEPYEDSRTYIQCDLKSYAVESISRSKIESTLSSLAQQVACADISTEWQSKYTLPDRDFTVAGMLFIYNHDGGYDRTFSDALSKLKLEKLDLPPSGKIVVLGPVEIHWLNNVAQEIMRMRGRPGRDKLPPFEHCGFYYPQQVRRAQVRGAEQNAATIEMLTGPWIILQYGPFGGQSAGYIIFYREDGETVDEFLYLVDFLRQHSLLGESHEITIRAFSTHGLSMSNFDKARLIYKNQVIGANAENVSLGEAINRIKYVPMNNVVSQFCPDELGSSYDR
jgi:hypothetical protein